MTKKTMLLAFAAAAMYVVPAGAAAQEVHISGVTTFTGGGSASTLSATGEPLIVSNKISVSGSFSTGSSTTGTASLKFTEVSVEFFGIKGECHTSGDAAGVVTSGGTFHVVTVNNKPGLLVTPVVTTLTCANFSNIKVSGNLIGTITSPACGSSSKALTLIFEAVGSAQNHTSYTGVTYTLAEQTGSGSLIPAGYLSGTITLTSATSGTLECT